MDIEILNIQAGILKQRFIDKGYDPGNVESDLRSTLEVDRSSLLKVKPKRVEDDQFK